MIRLKNCPFCGCVAVLMDRVESDGNLVREGVVVKCLHCETMTRPFYTNGPLKVGSYSDAEKMAAEAWNRRTEE